MVSAAAPFDLSTFLAWPPAQPQAPQPFGPNATAPIVGFPNGTPTADQFELANDPASVLRTLLMGAMGFDPTAFDQDLMALLVMYFESRQSELARSQNVGRLGPQRFSGQPTRTSWAPQPSSGGSRSSGGGGSRPPMTPGRPANVDTTAPANFNELPQGERGVGTFLRKALEQNGDEYEYGAGRNVNNANPDEFDCSGLVYWSLAQAGLDPNVVGGYSGAQSANTRTIGVDEALRTPGALLFYEGHVAISLGDGRTIEAMGEKWGVTIDEDATDRRWTHGGLVPGMDYGGSIGVVA